MIKKIQKKLFAWLYTSPAKKPTADYIKVEKNIRKVSFNLKKIYFKDIVLIDSSTEKNYCRITTLNNNTYYYNSSIDTLIKMASEPILRINKKQAINTVFVSERLNNAYAFINKTPYKIGDSYKQTVEDFFHKQQQ